MAVELMTEDDDIFRADVDALVVPVNCHGVMGAGLAAAARRRWPEIMPPYKMACCSGVLAPGRLMIVAREGVDVVCLATKEHWSEDSDLDAVRTGVYELGIVAGRWSRIAVPALGCGLGRLDWEPVREALEATFTDHNTTALVYPPR